ncbi:MAG: SRPBCC domain-containing protein [Gemmatimonadota bacterium]
MEVRPGGAFHYCHGFPDHPDVWVAGEYREVAPPERLSFACWFSDAEGGRVERPGFPARMEMEVKFEVLERGTRVRVRHAGLVEDQGEVQGWRESLDRLAELLAAHPTPNGEDR